MKKLILLFCLAGFFAQQTKAQTQMQSQFIPLNNEVYAGIGVFGTNSIIDTFTDILVTGITAGIYSSDASFSPVYDLGYKRLLGERTEVGGAYSYAYSRSDAKIDGEKTGEFRNSYHTITVGTSYKWLLRNKFAMYSSAEAGITIFQQKYAPNEGKSSRDNTIYFNFQLSPLGFKYGYQYGPFAELGFGHKGIINAGMFARF